MVHPSKSRSRHRPQFFPSTAAALLLASVLMAAGTVPPSTDAKEKCLLVLQQIYAEVKELGPYPGEDFIRRQFFVGRDEDDTNKNIHVAFLIQAMDAHERMTIRVTEMTKDPGNPRASLAGRSRLITCRITGTHLEVLSSDYPEKDLAELAPQILTAIRNKKKLLELNPYGNGRPG